MSILSDKQIKEAMKTISCQDIMFNPEDYLEEGHAVAEAAYRETLKMVLLKELL